MDTIALKDAQDRWWIVALSAAIPGTGLVILLWNFPTSRLVWLLAGFVLLFVAILLFNPRYRYWRRANWCFGFAGVLAFVPTIAAKANLTNIGELEFVSESSPLVVLGFLIVGLYLSWIDSQQNASKRAPPITAQTNSNLTSEGSPHAVMGLNAGGDIFVNHGISESTFLEALESQKSTLQKPLTSGNGQYEVDEDLEWRLIDDIRSARRRLENEEVTRLIADLQIRFERFRNSWSKVLRIEALLLIAEEERANLLRSQTNRGKIDLARLRQLLQELHDV